MNNDNGSTNWGLILIKDTLYNFPCHAGRWKTPQQATGHTRTHKQTDEEIDTESRANTWSKMPIFKQTNKGSAKKIYN